MNLSAAPISNRLHISFFGCTNAGKSSLINAFSNQDLSIVSSVRGTTTDPVKKTMELLPLGPVVIFDTAGFDDESELSQLRISKTKEILKKTDIAILVVDSTLDLSNKDTEFINLFKKENIPYIIAYNKADLIQQDKKLESNEIYVSAKTKKNIENLRNLVGSIKKDNKEKFIIIDKLDKKDIIILNIPIDESAPKGRLILPQQLVLRELLDNHNIVLCSQTQDLKRTIDSLKTKPKLVITDSQAYKEVKDIVPFDILLTSFSILFANYKGNLKTLIEGAKKISELKSGDKILISEGCTHHRQCNDIGSKKFPKWLKEFRGFDFNFEFSQGNTFPLDNSYDLIIHCGGCMLNEKEMLSRIKLAKEKNTPVTNYGIAISYMEGILARSLEIFPEVSKILD